MIVCHCRRVSDRHIREAVRGGCTELSEVQQACGAATRCGGCAALVEDVVEDELARGNSHVILAASVGRRQVA